jgi:hypothetical protein
MVSLSASVAFAAIVGIACQKASSESSRPTDPSRQCDDINARIKGIDTEIRLRYNEVADVKFREQAFGHVGVDLFKAAQKHTEEIIKLRGQRAEFYYRANSQGCTGLDSPTDDKWDEYLSLDKWKAVRDPSKPEGYALVCISASGC